MYNSYKIQIKKCFPTSYSDGLCGNGMQTGEQFFTHSSMDSLDESKEGGGSLEEKARSGQARGTFLSHMEIW